MGPVYKGRTFQAIHYAVFLTQNVNILATVWHRAREGRPFFDPNFGACSIEIAQPVKQASAFLLLINL